MDNKAEVLQGVDYDVITTSNGGMTPEQVAELALAKIIYVGDDTFMMTYGDGLSDVNLKNLINFHKKNKKISTLTAVRPPARFGVLKLAGNKVDYFKEKSKLDAGWINGGFFVMEPEIFKFIKNDDTYLEREPLEILTKKKQLLAYKHQGFWQCMDTKRDKDRLEAIFRKKRN